MRAVISALVVLAGGCILDNPSFGPSTATETSAAGSTGATLATTSAGATTGAATSGESTTGAATTAGASASSTGATTTDTGTTDTSASATDTTTGEPPCEPSTPALLAGAEIVMAPKFAELYTTYELGPVPGLPPTAPLGGMAIHFADDDTLLIGGFAETADGKLYAIPVDRGPCGHILGFAGDATPVAETPHISDLFFIDTGLLFYSEWDKNFLAQLLPGEMTPAKRTGLGPLGVDPSGGGIALVPPGLAGAGGLRVLSYDTGTWYRLDRTPNGALFDLGQATAVTTLALNSSGVAYVPAGSPGFDQPSVLISRDDAAKIRIYPVDAQGDPDPMNFQALFTAFPFANTTYFDRVTGDLLIATIAAPTEKLFIVQGFAPPPPLQG